MSTNTDLIPAASASLQVEQSPIAQLGWGESRIETIKNVLCPGIDDANLNLFAEVCLSTGLNPFKRQIYAVLRPKNEKVNGQWKNTGYSMTIQTGIDGLRIVAERSRKYRGQVGPLWTADGQLWVEAWIWNEPPAACKVGVCRQDFDAPLWAVATFREYVQKNKDGEPNSMWMKMPALMLAKCAEALALRKAFPDDLSGVYTSDEMQQADNGGGAMAPAPRYSAPSPSPKDREVGEFVDAEIVPDANQAAPPRESKEERAARLKNAQTAFGDEYFRVTGQKIGVRENAQNLLKELYAARGNETPLEFREPNVWADGLPLIKGWAELEGKSILATEDADDVDDTHAAAAAAPIADLTEAERAELGEDPFAE